MRNSHLSKLVESALTKMGDGPLDEIIKNVCAGPEWTEYKQKVIAEITGLGPIEDLLANSEITEICVNDFDKIFIEVGGKLLQTEERFCSELTYKLFVQNLLLRMNKVADGRHPLVDGSLSCGARIHISLPPVCKKPCVTIRKHNTIKLNLCDLKKLNMFTDKFYESLLIWIKNKKNILVCGPAGSGKTTLLRACLLQVAEGERIISLEDTSELGLLSPQHVSLTTRQDPEELLPQIDLSVLLKNTLRMRPDRIVVGEVRSEEASILLDCLATGHRGSFSTLHAQSAEHALKRLESLVLRANPKWDLLAIRQLIKDSIDIVIVCKKENGLRFVSQAASISSVESFGYLLDSETY